MGLDATYNVRCDVKLAANCRQVETVTREQKPNERLPSFVVPPGWVQLKTGMVCPECAVMING